MQNNKHVKQGGGSAFFWGLVIGALLATLLTTKNGRKILHELVDIVLSMMEDFAEKKKTSNVPVVTAVKNTVNNIKEDIREEVEFKKAVDEINSEIAEDEQPGSEDDLEVSSTPVQVIAEEEEIVVDEKEESPKSNGHAKKRLFHGIRKAK